VTSPLSFGFKRTGSGGKQNKVVQRVCWGSGWTEIYSKEVLKAISNF